MVKLQACIKYCEEDYSAAKVTSYLLIHTNYTISVHRGVSLNHYYLQQNAHIYFLLRVTVRVCVYSHCWSSCPRTTQTTSTIWAVCFTRTASMRRPARSSCLPCKCWDTCQVITQRHTQEYTFSDSGPCVVFSIIFYVLLQYFYNSLASVFLTKF